MVILYAEDDPEDVETFNEVIKLINPQITCIHARDGIEALAILENSAVLPDLIFLDLNMPSMDGKACLTSLKKDTRFRNIPVFIYTTGNRKGDLESCKRIGAADYIIKPNTFHEAIDRLSKVLRIPLTTK